MTTTLFAALALVTGAPNGAPELTIYNQGFALIKENRTFHVRAGRQTLAVEDVAATIDATSVGFKCLDTSNPFEVLEQNYQYDLISPAAILNKSVGKRVRFIRTIGNQRDVLEGVLISAPNAIVSAQGGSQSTYNGMVIRTDDGRIVLDPTGEIEVREVPAGLISKPTLLWEVESARAGDFPVGLSYIANGFSWNADYVLTLGANSKADMQGWVTVTNGSGTQFKDAKLKLLAGDVNTASRRSPEMARGGAMAMMKADNGFKEETLFEYHLYTLQRPTTLSNRETKQVMLLEGTDIPTRKRLIVDSLQGIGTFYPNEGEIGTGAIVPQVRVEFTNDKASGMGVPLPKGRVRVYQRDASGSVQMLGEDNINHTPRDERISLVVGRSFDVRASRKRTNFTRVSDRSVSESFEVEVRNRKEVSETVEVVERHWGDWKVTKKNAEFVKDDSNTIVFNVNLKAGETRTISYTVETRW